MDQVMKQAILDAHHRLGKAEAEIRELRRQAAEKGRGIRADAEKANASLRQLIHSELVARRMSWCTICASIAEGSGSALLLIEESSKVIHRLMIYEKTERLHAACDACVQRSLDRHGSVGPYDAEARGQEIFLAFRVEEREDGLYVRRFGEWVRLPSEKFSKPEIPEKVLEDLIRTLDLPPFCEIKERKSGHLQVVYRPTVCEPVTPLISPEQHATT